MAMVLDAFVSKFSEVLVSFAKEEAVMVLGVHDEIKRLGRRLERIQDVLADAERRRLHDRSINRWVNELKDVMYDADDIIDECRIDSEKHKDSSSSPTRHRVLRSLLLFSCIGRYRFRHEIGNRIKSLNLRLDEISKDQMDLHLISTFPTHHDSHLDNRISRGTTHLVEPDIKGEKIEQDTWELVELLTKENNQKIVVFAIVGIGGIGKTTLAQKIYSNQTLTSNFKEIPPVWVCVSQDYSEADLLRAIISRAGGSHNGAKEKEDLVPLLSEVVRNKRLFLVLDDVWDALVWTHLLRTPLQSSAIGSRVLVTTRNLAVAKQMGAVHCHQVEKLSLEDGWSLLSTMLSLDEDGEDMEDLTDIGVKIVDKCDGLPLAIRTVAGVLQMRDKAPSEWEKVLHDPAWSLTEAPDGVMGALFLSFQDLPSYLKQCWLFMALFPEDIRHDRETVSCFWIAEGFVEEKGKYGMEELAGEYWKELVLRSLLQPEDEHRDGSVCRMHDLLRSLAQHLAQYECFHGDEQGFSKIVTSSASSSIRPRRVYISDTGMTVVPDVIKECVSLRTLMLPHIQNVSADVFRKLRCLRVVRLGNIESVPDSIGNLIHLRYLNLSESEIQVLPESIGELRNLQFLILSGCKHLLHLPLGITKLCSLRHLDLDSTALPGMPTGMEKLQCLRLLRGFALSEGGNEDSNAQFHQQGGWCSLEELKSLSGLTTLHINNLERLTSTADAQAAALTTKIYLKELKLCCNYGYNKEGAIDINEEVFEGLCPPLCLERLQVERYFGMEYPSWMLTPSSIPNLKKLWLTGCLFLEELPPVWKLPQLEFLCVSGASGIIGIGPELVGFGGGVTAVQGRGKRARASFPKLQHLCFQDMVAWEYWWWLTEEEEEHQTRGWRLLPCLEKLTIKDCPELRYVPDGLLRHATALKELWVEGTCKLRQLTNFPTVVKLTITNTVNLLYVSNFPTVKYFNFFNNFCDSAWNISVGV